MRQRTILLVEDNSRDTRLIKRAFDKTAFLHDLRVVSDGDVALSYLRASCVHAMVSARQFFTLIESLGFNLCCSENLSVSLLQVVSQKVCAVPPDLSPQETNKRTGLKSNNKNFIQKNLMEAKIGSLLVAVLFYLRPEA